MIDLSEADRSMVGLVGGKAAGLGEVIGAGERVPPGLCLTTEAHRAGAFPRRSSPVPTNAWAAESTAPGA